jgi:alpha-amylase
VAFDRYLQSRESVRDGYLLAHFLSSHDVPGAFWQLEGDVEGFLLAATLQFTTAGLPTIYYGEEVGRLGGDWPDNRSDMPWGDRKIQPGAGKGRNESLRDAYRKLIAIRRGHPALSRGVHQPVSSEGDLLVFGRRLEGSETVYVAVNRGTAAATASIPVGPGAATSWRDVWNDVEVPVRDGVLEFEVRGRGSAIVALRSP